MTKITSKTVLYLNVFLVSEQHDRSTDPYPYLELYLKTMIVTKVRAFNDSGTFYVHNYRPLLGSSARQTLLGILHDRNDRYLFIFPVSKPHDQGTDLDPSHWIVHGRDDRYLLVFPFSEPHDRGTDHNDNAAQGISEDVEEYAS